MAAGFARGFLGLIYGWFKSSGAVTAGNGTRYAAVVVRRDLALTITARQDLGPAVVTRQDLKPTATVHG